MSLPDLSFLLHAQSPRDGPGDTPSPEPSAPDERIALQPQEALPGLIAELRAYQAELEAQNKVLQYSQAAAESASERFEALFSSVPLALMVLDEYDVVVQANAMAHRSFQPTEQDRPLTALMPFLHARDSSRVQDAFRTALQQGHSEVTEVVFLIGSEGRITGDLHIACIEVAQESDTPVHQFLCAVIDQSPLLAERHALQERNEQLHASEKRLEAVINSALDAIICVDQHQRITVFNPTAAALFQCSTSDALGSPLDRFLPDAVQALGFAQLTTQALLGEMTARTAAGGELAVEVSVSFERHADGETTTVFARDLTGRKKAEVHRAELETQLRESHKMQAIGTMAGGIAHDFNNILGAILGNVELAKADCGSQSPVLESLIEIEKAGRRARDLVRQILTFSRNDPPGAPPWRWRRLCTTPSACCASPCPPRSSSTWSCRRTCRLCWPIQRRWSRPYSTCVPTPSTRWARPGAWCKWPRPRPAQNRACAKGLGWHRETTWPSPCATTAPVWTLRCWNGFLNLSSQPSLSDKERGWACRSSMA